MACGAAALRGAGPQGTVILLLIRPGETRSADTRQPAEASITQSERNRNTRTHAPTGSCLRFSLVVAGGEGFVERMDAVAVSKARR